MNKTTTTCWPEILVNLFMVPHNVDNIVGPISGISVFMHTVLSREIKFNEEQ